MEEPFRTAEDFSRPGSLLSQSTEVILVSKDHEANFTETSRELQPSYL